VRLGTRRKKEGGLGRRVTVKSESKKGKGEGEASASAGRPSSNLLQPLTSVCLLASSVHGHQMRIP
jgi:hypothetical protein